MIGSKCPGQDTRNWTYDSIVEVDCPGCGNSLEFWKTDIRLRCRNCGRLVVNKKFDMGCAEWCAYAEQCIGGAAKGYKPDTLRKKLENAAAQLLNKDEKEKLDKIIKESEDKALGEGKELLQLVASAVFNAINRKYGPAKVEEVINGMVENGAITPDIASKLREEAFKND